MCLALHYCLFSLSSASGGEGRGEEAPSPGEARPSPSPTFPPLVPRGERETCVANAKYKLRHCRRLEWMNGSRPLPLLLLAMLAGVMCVGASERSKTTPAGAR